MCLQCRQEPCFSKSYAPRCIQPTKSFQPAVSSRLVPRCRAPGCSGNQPTHCSSFVRPANPSPLHNCIYYGNKMQLLLRRAHHATDLPTCQGTGERRCLYVPISCCRTLALGSVMDGLLVTPKEVGGPLYHDQEPLKKLHMGNKAERKQGLVHVVKGYTSPTDVPKSASIGRCAGDMFSSV